MGSTRTPGITIDATGNRFINKQYHGLRVFFRLGPIGQENAEERLRTEIARMDLDRVSRSHSRPLFRHCAARYLAQSRNKRSIETIEWHVRLLIAHLGDLEPHKVHDGTLEGFVLARTAAGTSATTINRSLEVARTSLKRQRALTATTKAQPMAQCRTAAHHHAGGIAAVALPHPWNEQDRLSGACRGIWPLWRYSP